ncbi:hypothetical protein ACQUQU_15000 [Thalassolituus sp. LLYu03]|uniref:hypothetical protein n=1 Tax=Thalassolituus sp. LLYu03 TaxID=3421656 RepID=UPI003D299942
MTIHLFIVETELQLLAGMAIEDQYISDEDDVIHYFVTSEKLLDAAFQRNRKNVTLLNRQHHGGFLGKIRYIKENTNQVLDVVQEAPEASFGSVLYVPRIDDIYNNVLVGQFRKQKLGKVALLPDGALNIFSGEITKALKKRLQKWSLKFRLLAPGYNVLKIDGDELGADSQYIDSVFTFNGFITGYPADKEQYIDFPVCMPSENLQQTAMVIGQNFLAYQQGNVAFVEAVSAEIQDLLSELKPEHIFYAPHPRSSAAEFMTDGMESVLGPYLCIEEVIASLGCTYVISCNSTALFTARLINPEIQCYSVGAESSPAQSLLQREALLQAMKKVGVVTLKLSSSAHGA